jgi:hypothetical protein
MVKYMSLLIMNLIKCSTCNLMIIKNIQESEQIVYGFTNRCMYLFVVY